MALKHLGFVDLPKHVNDGGFDHADVHKATGLTYVAHTANDAIDVLDVQAQLYLGSIPGLAAVAGALVSEDPAFVFTSNRGENTLGMFAPASSAVSELPRLSHLYVAVGDPGVIEVFDTTKLQHHEVARTESGAHTLSFDSARNLVCAFLPGTHRAAVYRDHP